MGFPKQQQEVPGVQSVMDPVPDCGENSYRGSGRLKGKRAVITGGDSGIGRACFFDVRDELLAVWPSADRAPRRSMSR